MRKYRKNPNCQIRILVCVCVNLDDPFLWCVCVWGGAAGLIEILQKIKWAVKPFFKFYVLLSTVDY